MGFIGPVGGAISARASREIFELVSVLLLARGGTFPAMSPLRHFRSDRHPHRASLSRNFSRDFLRQVDRPHTYPEEASTAMVENERERSGGGPRGPTPCPAFTDVLWLTVGLVTVVTLWYIDPLALLLGTLIVAAAASL